MNLPKHARLLVRPWSWRALVRGVAAGIEHEHLRSSCGNLATVIDVGANRGQFALLARRCFPEARILSFEPLPAPAARFRRVFRGDGQVSLCETAIGPRNGAATLHVSARDDSSSLLPITERQEQIFPGTAEVDRVEVPVCRLEQVVPAEALVAPALLKIDVQGSELEVLVGSESLLARFQYIYVELSFEELYRGQALAHEVIGWLAERSYALTGVCDVAHEPGGRPVQADFLFTRLRRATAQLG